MLDEISLPKALAVLVMGVVFVGCSNEASGDGCDDDDDCKGDRVCDDGECVETTSTAAGSCAVCGAASLTCAFASGHQEDKTFDSSTQSGCTMTFDGDVVSVDCDAGQVCYEADCSAQTIDNSFTFTFQGAEAVVCEPT